MMRTVRAPGLQWSFCQAASGFFHRVFWLVMVVLLAAAGAARAGNFYSNITPATVPWPGGTVPYDFSNSVTTVEQQTYLNGLREWELAANVKFVPHTTQANWIRFCYNTSYLDYVQGGSYSPQIVTVSSLGRAQVCHEMGHSFGFTHENIRPDATNFVLVLTNNISNEPSNIYWFTIDPTSVTNGNYDYESVMHLGWDFDSTNVATATQQPKGANFPKYQYRMGNYCLSPGDRAALAYLYGALPVPLSNVVTNTADAGLGSLRAALYYVEDHPGAKVTFNIPTSDAGYSNGVYNIHLTGMLPPLAFNGMVIDGSTQPGYAGRPLIMIDGSQILPETFTSDTGLLVYSSSNQVKDVSFSGFVWNGLTFEYPFATNNTVAGCWLGVDSTGTNAAPNAYQGILVTSGSGHNTFGGTTAAARNVISGNAQYGIFIAGSNDVDNVIEGNYIGTDPSGSIAVPNQISGVFIGGGTTGNIIGGTTAAARNVLSGNAQYGVWLSDTNTTGNLVENNYIGTDVTGSNAMPNVYSGMFLGGGASGNTISYNVLSGNDGYGIFMTNSVANVISENYIGVTASGETALGNTFSGLGLFGNDASNSIGPGNVLSGNIGDPAGYGIEMGGATTANNFIFGNFIGTDAKGTNGLGIQPSGIGIFDGANGNVIGNATGGGNVISGNAGPGIDMSDPGTTNNVILGNLIGTDVTGSNAIPNENWGIFILSNANGNTIGGTTAGARNVISATMGYGYGIALAQVNSNVVEGNYIGTDISGKNALPNGFAGVAMESGAVGNVIGGPNAGQGNVIADTYLGVTVYDDGTTNDPIRGNAIFGNSYGIALDQFPGNHTGYEAGPEDFQNYPVITNAFGLGGSTVIQGNFNSLPGDAYYIDFYANATAAFDEGQTYLGFVRVTTDGSGNALFTYTNTSANLTGQYISATATAATGDSSEFAADVVVTNLPTAYAQVLGPFRLLTNGFVFNLTFETNFSYHIQATTNLATNPIPWVNLTNFTATNVSLIYTDHAASSFHARFYRVTSP
jgi:parallel beta-helix repeat protein